VIRDESMWVSTAGFGLSKWYSTTEHYRGHGEKGLGG
jgi:hypothetical protein